MYQAARSGRSGLSLEHFLGTTRWRGLCHTPTPILDKTRVNLDPALEWNALSHRGTGSGSSAPKLYFKFPQSSIWTPRCPRISESPMIAPKMLTFQVGQEPITRIDTGLVAIVIAASMTRKVPCRGPASNFLKAGGDVGILCC